MWFIPALAAMLLWGGADLFYKLSSRPEDKYSALKIVMTVGLVMGAQAGILLLTSGEAYNFSCLIAYLPVSMLYILSMTVGYVGLKYLELSVASPVQNTSGAMVPILCFFALGMRMSGLQIVAVCAICAGLVALGVLEKRGQTIERGKYTISALAILLPLGYALLDALGTFADAWILTETLTENEAEISYSLTFLICGLLAAVYVYGLRREKLGTFFSGITSRGGAAILETAGQYCYVYAMAASPMTAAPMIASYSIVSVVLSRIFLKEKLSKAQYAAVILVMLGIALLGYLEGMEE